MQAQYYVVLQDDPNNKLEFSNVESIINFLLKKPENEGEFYLTGRSGIKITYSIKTGTVMLDNIEKKEWITTLYSESAFKNDILPIEQAIRWLAKFHLLNKIYNLEDPMICKLIEKMGKLAPNTSERSLDKILSNILYIVQPDHYSNPSLFSTQTRIQKAIYLACEEQKLYSHGFDQIKSKDDVDGIMNKISKYNEARNFQAVPKANPKPKI